MEPSKKPLQAKPQTSDVDALREEIAKLKDIAGRAQADLQNARMRMEKEAQGIREFAFEGVLRKLIPTVDNLKRAFQNVPEELKKDEWVKGIHVLEQALLKDLADVGLSKMEAIGTSIDPMKHEVLQTGPGPQDQIIEVFEDGYEFRGKVLRPAKVKVGDGTSLPA